MNLHDGQADEADISACDMVSILLGWQQGGASFQSSANVCEAGAGPNSVGGI